MSNPVVGYIFASVNPTSLTQINGLAVYSAANLDDDFTTILALFNVGTAFPDSPQVGTICLRTDLGAIYMWNGTAWVQNTAFTESITVTGTVAARGITDTTPVSTNHTLKFAVSGTWTVPTGITSILVNAGAGGGGGGASEASEAGGGGGGSGEAVLFESINVTAGDSLTITVGAGGVGGVSGGAGATAGGVTSIIDSTTSTTLLSLIAGGGGGYGSIQGLISGGSGYPSGQNGYWDSANTEGLGGAGGSSIFGGGGAGTIYNNSGKSGLLSSGGSGASGGTSGQNGGAGGAGIVIIQW